MASGRVASPGEPQAEGFQVGEPPQVGHSGGGQPGAAAEVEAPQPGEEAWEALQAGVAQNWQLRRSSAAALLNSRPSSASWMVVRALWGLQLNRRLPHGCMEALVDQP